MKLLLTYSSEADLKGNGSWINYLGETYYTGTKHPMQNIDYSARDFHETIKKGNLVFVKELLKNF